jgi:hypothetical protein
MARRGRRRHLIPHRRADHDPGEHADHEAARGEVRRLDVKLGAGELQYRATVPSYYCNP